MPEYTLHLRALVGGDELLQIPAVTVALRDDAGRVLLGRHANVGAWVLPGGAIEPGEVPSDAALREMFEETGSLVRLTRLVGVFGGPDFIIRYRNGDQTSYVTALFEAELEAGIPHPDQMELLELRFVDAQEAEGLPTASWVSAALNAVFHGEPASGFQPATWRPPTAP